MEQAQETAAEAEAERQRALGLEGEAGIVELKFLETGAELLIVVGVHGVYARKHHGLDGLEALDGLVAGGGGVGDGVAHAHLLRGLDAADDIAHIACREFLARLHVEAQHAHLVGVILAAGAEELHVVASAEGAIDDAEIGNDAAEGVEHRVEHQRLQGGGGVALGGGDALHNGIEHLGHAHAGLGRATEDVLVLAAQQVHNLVGHLLGHGTVEVDLVHHRDDFKIVVYGQIEVGDGLRLDALRGIHHEQGSLAGGDGTRHLIGEVDVTRGINQIEGIVLVAHLDGVALDGDATLLFQFHVVEHLVLHVALADGVGRLEQTVGKGALAMVDMGYDAEVAYILHC